MMNVKFLYNHHGISNSIGERLKYLISKTKNEVIIMSPYISNNPLIDMIYDLNGIKLRVLTRFSLEDFLNDSSDINIIDRLVKNPNSEVRYYSNLHAKIYIIDRQKAIVTSANFTQNGMYNNLEYGVLIENNLDDMLEDINNLWNKAGVINDKKMALIQNKLDVFKKNKNQMYGIRNQVIKIDKKVVKQKKSHQYKEKNQTMSGKNYGQKEDKNHLNKINDKIVYNISEYKALNLIINECNMKNFEQKIFEIYNLIKNNIPISVRSFCKFRYRKNKREVDVAMNIMNYRIFLFPFKNKPIVQIIYPKINIYDLKYIIPEERLTNISEEWIFKNIECYILYLSFDEVLKFKKENWKSFAKACLIAYNGKKTRMRDSNMIVDWNNNENGNL
ncbi:phospholipase D family protein [Clostridium sp. JNZ X4-2]